MQFASHEAIRPLPNQERNAPRLPLTAPGDQTERRAAATAHRVATQLAMPQQPTDGSSDKPQLRQPPSASRPPTSADPTPPGPGSPLAPEALAWAESALGSALDHVRIHTGTAASAAAGTLEARAFTVGDHVTFAAGQFAPETPAGRHLLAHELAHVIHDGQDPAIRRVGAHDPPFGYFPAERELLEREREERRLAAERTASWRRQVGNQASSELANQAGSLSQDVEDSRLGVLTARAGVLQRLSAQLPHGFADAWATARTSIELITVGLQPDAEGNVPTEITDDVQDHVRERLTAFYALLRSWEVSRHDDAVATARNNYLVWQMQQLPIRNSRFADRRPPDNATPPPAPGMAVRNRASAVSAAISPTSWRRVLADFDLSTRLVDSWSLAMLAPDAPERQALEQTVALHTRQAELLRTRPNATKIRAVFYPKDQLTTSATDGDAPAPPRAAVGIPWHFYLYKKDGDPDWHLEDLQAPGKRVNVHDQTAREGIESFARSRYGLPPRVDPPADLWEQLNSKLRFPKGELHLVLPSGAPYRLVTTEPTSLSEYLGYGAMALGLVALTLGTGGLGTAALVATVGAAGLGIASTVAHYSELDQHGMATSADRAKAALAIVADLASIATLGLGRIATGAARAGALASTTTRLAGRLYLPVARLSVGLESTRLLVMTSDFVAQYRAISNQPGMTDEQRSAARTQLVLVAMATGALSLWSIRSTVRDIRAHRDISADDLLPGMGPRAPHAEVTGPPAPAAVRSADYRLGRARIAEGVRLDESLSEGTVHVLLKRNQLGLVSEIEVVHGPRPAARGRAFDADIAAHQQVALLAQRYSGLLGEIRLLLRDLAASVQGQARGTFERQLDIAKLEGRIQDRLTRLSGPRRLSAQQRLAYENDVESFARQIRGHRQAIARGEAYSGRIAQEGRPDGYPVAPAGHVYRVDPSTGRWELRTSARGGPKLSVEFHPDTGLPTGRITNQAQLDTQHVIGTSISDATVRQRLTRLGYEIGPDNTIRPALGVDPNTAAAMARLEVAGGRIQLAATSAVGTTARLPVVGGRVARLTTLEQIDAARRQLLGSPPGPRASARTRLDWADYHFYVERKLRMVENALSGRGEFPKDPPRTFASFQRDYPLGNINRNSIQGARFEARVKQAFDDAFGEHAGQLRYQHRISESTSPTAGRGEMTQPDVILPGGEAMASLKSRTRFLGLSPARTRAQVDTDLHEIVEKYTGVRQVRRDGTEIEIRRAWLTYDEAGITPAQRVIIEDAVRDFQRQYRETHLRFEVLFL